MASSYLHITRRKVTNTRDFYIIPKSHASFVEDATKPRKAVIPKATDVLKADDKLIVFAETKDLDNLS